MKNYPYVIAVKTFESFIYPFAICKRFRSVVGAFIAAVGMIGASAATDFCQQTSHDAPQACMDTPEGDQSIAFGKCDNVSDPTGRSDCRKQAAADFKTATQTCHDQFDARQAACQRLCPATDD